MKSDIDINKVDLNSNTNFKKNNILNKIINWILYKMSTCNSV